MKKFQKFSMMTIVVVFLSVVMNSSNCPPPADPPQPCPSFGDPAYESGVFFPHASSCYHFWHCSNGVAYCVACPAGLHWNAEFETCDWPHNAGCKPEKPLAPCHVTITFSMGKSIFYCGTCSEVANSTWVTPATQILCQPD